ncbi:uncharacterized protein METZ01_LOCUS471400, partial [marine metagenome]
RRVARQEPGQGHARRRAGRTGHGCPRVSAAGRLGDQRRHDRAEREPRHRHPVDRPLVHPRQTGHDQGAGRPRGHARRHRFCRRARRRKHRKALHCRRRYAQPFRHRGQGVRGAGRGRRQHPDDLYQRDQDLRRHRHRKGGGSHPRRPRRLPRL